MKESLTTTKKGTVPRAAGNYATALRMARENNIPVMQIVAMSSYNSARPQGNMGLKATGNGSDLKWK